MRFSIRSTALACLCAATATASLAQEAAPSADPTAFAQCLAQLRSSAAFNHISDHTWQQHVAGLTPDASVLPLLNKQPEFSLPAWDYLAVLVDQERVADGRAAYQQWQPVLRRIQQRYGVEPAVVLGVWGVESNFGRITGGRPLLQSLGTLSCFGRRQAYFRTEFASALRIVQEGSISADKLKGSWAGAFGQTQFMPSTFLRTAVDFDGDGRRDLIDNVPDALASTANFLRKAGYVAGQPWGYEVKLPAGFDASQAGRRKRRSVDAWAAQGVTLPNGQPLPHSPASLGLLLPAGPRGPAFLVGKNFDTFYSYNASENYALAIAHLSNLIVNSSQHVGFATPWPTDDPGLSRAENRELQTLLLARGHDIGQPDGLIGAKTRAAIRTEQARLNMPVNGRGGQKLLRALRK
ncbi:MAG: lytic murein transglycosylase [Brachymonas sp.]|nr:lytic murein transglycosylase [Brachymonas sp.]